MDPGQPGPQRERSLLGTQKPVQQPRCAPGIVDEMSARVEAHSRAIMEGAKQAFATGEITNSAQKAALFDRVVLAQLGPDLFTEHLFSSELLQGPVGCEQAVCSSLGIEIQKLITAIPRFEDDLADGLAGKIDWHGVTDDHQPDVDTRPIRWVEWLRATPNVQHALERARDVLESHVEWADVIAGVRSIGFKQLMPSQCEGILRDIRSVCGAFDGVHFPEISDEVFARYVRQRLAGRVHERELLNARSQIFGTQVTIQNFIEENANSLDRFLRLLEACDRTMEEAAKVGVLDKHHRFRREVIVVSRMTALLATFGERSHLDPAAMRDGLYAAASFAGLVVRLRDDIERRLQGAAMGFL
jgi:hypothetical protein